VSRLRHGLLPLGISLGLVAELAFFGGGAELAVADFAVGFVLIASGVVAWDRRPESRVGVLLTLAGFAWFLGTISTALVYLHRGPLSHLVLSYPSGRLLTRAAAVVTAAAYIDALIAPLAGVEAVTLALSAGIAVVALRAFLGTSGPARRAGAPALGAALAFAGVLALGSVVRLNGAEADETLLWTYDVVIALIALTLLVDLLRGRWAEAAVTGLVIDLGRAEETGTLSAKLGWALGDPTLEVGYPLPGSSSFVDDEGRPLEPPGDGSGRATTVIEDEGGRVAVLVHDEAVRADGRLLESVAAAARIAVANARMQAEARSSAVELQASRRRLVEAADAQRRRLEQELRLGAERRLETVRALLEEAREAADSGEATALSGLEDELDDARGELREFAQGMHPTALADGGVLPALEVLAARSPLPIEVRGTVGRLPEALEAALFFVCSEAAANAGKHARASHVSITVGQELDEVRIVIADDGIGGADLSQGTGLRGIADRVEALGGRLRVESPPGAGTRILVELPVAVSRPAGRAS
jgi:signal transduction histidine kinase